MDFTTKILKIMDERGISAYQICKNLHISNTTFSSWKKGTKPSIDKAIEILRYLQLSADEIFELTNKPEVITDEEKALFSAGIPERFDYEQKLIDKSNDGFLLFLWDKSGPVLTDRLR